LLKILLFSEENIHEKQLSITVLFSKKKALFESAFFAVFFA
jgi:hypothetical protein